MRRLRISYRGAHPTVENPRHGDSHGDVAAALAMAVFHISSEDSGGAVFAAPTAAAGSYGDYSDSPLDAPCWASGYDNW